MRADCNFLNGFQQAEGETQYRNKVVFVDLRDTDSMKTNVTVDIPKHFVADSEYVEVSAVGKKKIMHCFYNNFCTVCYSTTKLTYFFRWHFGTKHTKPLETDKNAIRMRWTEHA